MKDWDKRVSDAAEKFVTEDICYNGLEYPLSGNTAKECTQSFTAGANWAREDMEQRVEKLRLATVESIDALSLQCEAMALSLEKIIREYEILALPDNNYSDIIKIAQNALTSYKKFKEGGE